MEYRKRGYFTWCPIRLILLVKKRRQLPVDTQKIRVDPKRSLEVLNCLPPLSLLVQRDREKVTRRHEVVV